MTAVASAEDVPRFDRASLRELAIAAAIAGGAALLLARFGPPPGDAPAHLYRTFLLRDGALVWDNLWYGGQYPFASYSLLYYVPAAVFGNLPLALLSALVSAPLFVAIAYHEWGPVSRWPGRAFALLAAAPVFTGLYSYSLGFVAALASVRLFQRRRTVSALVCAALTLGFSPLAFVFLCLAVAASYAASRRRPTRRHVLVAVALGAIASVQLVALVLFPSTGVYPFNHWDLLALLSLCVLGVLLARRAARGGVLVAFFAIWGVGALVTFAIPSALGDNVTRIRAFVFPIMLVAAAQARFRPRALAVTALAVALGYNLVPYLMLIPYRLDPRPAGVAFWRPVLGYLGAHRNPNYRVEVVPTAAHWESYWLPRNGYALARGWYRQLDEATNPELYAKTLTPQSYDEWLHRMAVGYVVVPHTTLDPLGGPREAAVIRSDAAVLRVVSRSPDATIYRVVRPTPLLDGAAGAHITELTHELVAGVLPAGGSYLLRLRYSPYWRLGRRSSICLAPTVDGFTRLSAGRGGRFVLSMPLGLTDALGAVYGDGVAPRCG